MSDDEVFDINAVLTFVDQATGRRWLAGAMLGPLCAEGDTDERIAVADTIDRVMVLTSFKVVLPAVDGGQP